MVCTSTNLILVKQMNAALELPNSHSMSIFYRNDPTILFLIQRQEVGVTLLDLAHLLHLLHPPRLSHLPQPHMMGPPRGESSLQIVKV